MKIVKISLNEITEIVKKTISEQLGDYPLGAKDDPRSPYNQSYSDDEEIDTDPGKDIHDFDIKINSNGSYVMTTLGDILWDLEPEDADYFENAIANPNIKEDKEFRIKLNDLVRQWLDKKDPEWIEDIPDYDDEY